MITNLYHLQAKEIDYDQLNNMLVVSDSCVDALRMWPSNKNKGYASGEMFPFKKVEGTPLSVEEMKANVNIEMVGYTNKPIGTIIIKDYF